MTPTELREILLYAPLNDETFHQLPTEARGVWACQPNRREIAEVKQYMFLRVCLLVAGITYLAIFHVSLAIAWLFVCVAVPYEIAYYKLRSEKSELEYRLAKESYSRRVDELIQKLFPGRNISNH